MQTLDSLSAGKLRAAKRRERLEEERKTAAARKDKMAGATSGDGAASARDFITRSLHQREAPAEATSVGRLNINRSGAGLPGSGLAPPPKLPGKSL